MKIPLLFLILISSFSRVQFSVYRDAFYLTILVTLLLLNKEIARCFKADIYIYIFMWDHLINWLIQHDKNLFVFINSSMHKSWLDGFMLLMRNQYTWIPLYCVLVFKIYKTSPALLLPFVVASLACFAITDFTSASIIKPLVGRLRPCYDISLQNNIYILTGCGGKYSFPSSHASNHFGLAMVWYRIIFFVKKEKWNWVWWWAAIICFAQVYVGKHFPLDILGGALLGMAAGTLIAFGFKYWYNKKESIFRRSRFRQQNPPNSANKKV